MKYIRTKDTLFAVVGENEKVLVVRAKGNPYHFYNKSKRNTEIVAQADTIEELCDEFVIVGTNWQQIIDLESARYNPKRTMKVYGAIWTDKGLIYVAKMNDKGELKLL